MLQADPYARFDALYEGGGINEAACWAHARRKFHDLHVARLSPVTTEAFRRIDELYLIEAISAANQPTSAGRCARSARPLLDDLEQWLRASLEKLSRQSDTSAAIMYALSLWSALLRYCDNGVIEVDNSASERALCGIAV